MSDHPSTLELHPELSSYTLYGYLQQLSDPSGEKDLRQILSDFNHQKFSPIPGFLNLGYTQSASWISFRFRVSEQSPERYFLWLSPYILNFIDIYVQTGPDEQNPDHYLHHATGDHRETRNQPYEHSRYLLPLQTEPGKSYRVFIRTQTTSTHALRGWIRTETDVINQSNANLIWFTAFVAGSAILGLIGLLQAIRLQSSVQFWYGCYLLSQSCSQMAIQGFLPVLFPDIAHQLSDWMAGGGTAVSYFSMAFIIMHILNTGRDHRWLHCYLIVMSALAGITFFLSTTSWYGPMLSVLLPVGIVVLPVATALYFRKFSWSSRSQRLFLFFFLICTLGVTTHLLRLAGIIPVNHLTYSAMMINTMIHMILLNMALSEKLLDAEQEARHAAEISENRAVAIAKEMTRELMQSKEHLEAALSKEQQALKEQSRFLDMISHEYRTPLAIIRTNLDILDLKLETENNSQNNLKAIFTATKRLQEIFDTQLRKGQVSYQIIPEKQKIDAGQTIEDIFDDARSLWSDHDISLSNNIQSNMQLNADPALLKTLIFNLLDNAMKYSPANSQIDCYLDSFPDSHLQLTVYNPVSQIAPIALDQLCDKYVRGSNSAGSSGLGLGLYLVKRIAQVHDGLLKISVNEDTFCAALTLPVHTTMTPARSPL
ncbi:sensor histidine kinase [Oceanospirillum sediminis]|uniref:histidine kinase n=1 Tax=Oceanospirillum sediminis TaxID=2760088 RepID=A0A839IX88_9GAMM|nr:sensor histidine kinase [Oceanospirillum sediminis]